MIGSTTYPKNAGPAKATLVLATTQKLQKEIVLPLHEICDKTQSHKKIILLMYQSQIELQTLKSLVDKAKKNCEITVTKFQAVEKNANLLSQRSAAIFEASRSIDSKISQAEFEYFNHLKRLEILSNKWEERLKKIQNHIKMNYTWNRNENLPSSYYNNSDISGNGDDEAKCLLYLSEEQVQMCSDLLRGQDAMLKSSRSTLNQVDSFARDFMKKKGLRMDNHNLLRKA